MSNISIFIALSASYLLFISEGEPIILQDSVNPHLTLSFFPFTYLQSKNLLKRKDF